MEWTREAIDRELDRIALPVTTEYDEHSLPLYARGPKQAVVVALPTAKGKHAFLSTHEDGDLIFPAPTTVGRHFDIQLDELERKPDGTLGPVILRGTVKWDGAYDVLRSRRERIRAKKEKRAWLPQSERGNEISGGKSRQRRAA